MKTIALGRSGLEVSCIAFGTWQLGGEWGGFDEDTAVAAIRRARSTRHIEDSLAAADRTSSDTDLAEIEKIMAAATPVDGPSPERVR